MKTQSLHYTTETSEVSDEAEVFLEKAMTILQNNPNAEVDWFDKLVIELSFKNNQKAKCVYEKS